MPELRRVASERPHLSKEEETDISIVSSGPPLVIVSRSVESKDTGHGDPEGSFTGNFARVWDYEGLGFQFGFGPRQSFAYTPPVLAKSRTNRTNNPTTASLNGASRTTPPRRRSVRCFTTEKVWSPKPDDDDRIPEQHRSRSQHRRRRDCGARTNSEGEWNVSAHGCPSKAVD